MNVSDCVPLQAWTALTPTNQSRDVHRVALVVAAERQAAGAPTDGARPMTAATAQPAGHTLV